MPGPSLHNLSWACLSYRVFEKQVRGSCIDAQEIVFALFDIFEIGGISKVLVQQGFMIDLHIWLRQYTPEVRLGFA